MEVLRVGNDAYFMNLKSLSIITPGARGAFSHEHGHFPYNNLKLLTARGGRCGTRTFYTPYRILNVIRGK